MAQRIGRGAAGERPVNNKRGGAMLGMRLRFYVYMVLCAALLVMFVLDPHLLASSGIAAGFASIVAMLRGAFAGLT
jgi:hypothetical protein